ncbi:Transcriptional regulator, DeoR family [Candidatus Rhodobacter oscarellae]|uniref:Transcriptional regulator, DeoR family n=1 Tax=Candidatus Rhodobacter oscarellae TaxID=1675527 RepID=A0A0J9E648_9RHOB|nr:YafY family protein [Candidatus Rhodobacter lobularis]KMW58172.1 Transcriptional regulator, DeoR family [Candidatus Rhodobacter lobularis]
MRRADRLFQIVQALRGGRLVTAGALAEALEVSQRTIYRDIADLQASGVPVEGEAGYGYVMAEGFDLPPLMFTREEIVALVAGARLIRTWGGLKMAHAAEEALIKINAVLAEPERARAAAVQIHAIPMGDLDEKARALIDQLEIATDTRQRLELDYRDAEGTATRRIVRPLGLGFWGKVWTLFAWCETRVDFRMFRVDRIVSADAKDSFRPERGKTLEDFLAQEGDHGQRRD